MSISSLELWPVKALSNGASQAKSTVICNSWNGRRTNVAQVWSQYHKCVSDTKACNRRTEGGLSSPLLPQPATGTHDKTQEVREVRAGWRGEGIWAHQGGSGGRGMRSHHIYHCRQAIHQGNESNEKVTCLQPKCGQMWWGDGVALVEHTREGHLYRPWQAKSLNTHLNGNMLLLKGSTVLL